MKKIIRALAVILTVSLLAGCGTVNDPTQQTQETAMSAEDAQLLQERRDAAESYMRQMATVLWRAEEDIVWTTKKEVNTPELLEAYDGDPMIIRAGRLYQGIPYSYSGTSAYSFYQYFGEKDEKGYPTVSSLDWQALNGSASHTARIGNDCSGAVQLAWEYIGGNFTPVSTKYMTLDNGYLPVGEYENDPSANILTKKVCEENGVLTMFEAYAQLQKADAVVCRRESSGHTMMIVDVYVTYTEAGGIDGENSYVTVLHQTNGYLQDEAYYYNEELGEDVYKTFGVDDQCTFTKLFSNGYLPVTCDALVNADAVVEEHWVKDSETTYSYSNILEGKFTSNKTIAFVTITITDTNGGEVTKAVCFNPRQTYETEFFFDLTRFATEEEFLMQGKLDLELEPGTYHCTHVLTDSHGGQHVMRDFDFTV